MRTAIGICLSLILTIACGGSQTSEGHEYTLQGQILSIGGDHKTALIKHEEITGFMSAMTMTYKVRDAKQFEGLKPGDLITSTLVATDTDAYLKDVKRVGDAPLETAATAPTMINGVALVEKGAPVPDAHFVNQDGKPVAISDFRGSALVVTFTYTSCPMPTYCPLMDRNFAAIQTKLKEKNNDLHVRLLSVSIDPATDTPAVLKAHGAKLGLDPRIWNFVTGDRDDIDQFAGRFGVSISRATNDPKDITHNLRTVIIDRQGNLVQSYSGNEWTPEQVLADVRVMVGID